MDKQATDTTVKQFISEQSRCKNKKGYGYNMTHKWLFNVSQLKKGRPITYDDKLVNPKVLDISNLRKEKHEQK